MTAAPVSEAAFKAGSGKAITKPVPAVAVPLGTNTATKPGSCALAWLMVLTLMPGLELVDALPEALPDALLEALLEALLGALLGAVLGPVLGALLGALLEAVLEAVLEALAAALLATVMAGCAALVTLAAAEAGGSTATGRLRITPLRSGSSRTA